MSDEKRFFEEITPKAIAENGVVSLAIRPNQKSQYGTGGLSGKELQQRFDKLATLIISYYNEVAKALSSKEVLEYFKMPDETTLADFIKKITDDDYDIVSANPYEQGKEGKLSAIIQKFYTNIESLAAFTQLSNYEKGKTLSDIFAKTTALIKAIEEHNKATDNHTDIRRDLDTVKAFLSSDDGTEAIDRLHELIKLIQANAGTIDDIGKNKVNKSDIIRSYQALAGAGQDSVAGAKLLYDLFATKEELKPFISVEALTSALEPYAKDLRLGNTLKYLITNYQHAQTDIDGWIGKEDTWAVSADQPINGIKNGDPLLFRCFNTTLNQYSYVFAKAVEDYASNNRIRALSTSVIHSGASNTSGGIDKESIVTNLDDTSTDKVLAASVGALIKERIENAVKGLVSDTSLTEAIKGFVTKAVLDEAITSAVTDLVKRTDLDKTLANYALTTEVHNIAKDKITAALEAFDPGFNLPEDATDIFAEAFLTNGSFALQYDLFSEAAGCSGLGNCVDTAITIGSLAKGLPVVEIANDAFNGTGITSAILPETVKYILDYAFANCGALVCVTLPKKLSTIYRSAFLNCANLNSIIYNGEIYDWNKVEIASDNDVLTSATLYCIPEDVDVETNANGKSCTVKNIYFNAKDHADINIPAVINNYTVVAITSQVNYSRYPNLTGLWLPDGVTTIDSHTFERCNLMKTVRLPKALKTVGDSAFRNCTALTDIYYQGTEEDWNAISFGDRWNEGVNATIHYNYGG